MDVIIPSMHPREALEAIEKWRFWASSEHRYVVIANGPSWEGTRWGEVEHLDHPENLGPVGSYLLAANTIKSSYGLITHDDVEVSGPWEEWIISAFEMNPVCGVVGFHGATGYGVSGIYQHPYQLNDLARQDPVSNMTNAEQHGRRSRVPVRCTVVDGFAMAIRREVVPIVLKEWTAPGRQPHHQYDNDACLAAVEAGYEVWMVPVRSPPRWGDGMQRRL
jgi:hypothetical protein